MINRTAEQSLPGVGLAVGAGIGAAVGYIALGAAIGLLFGAAARAVTMRKRRAKPTP
ncbi:MAG TPA: hypothetical protein VII66_07580 [Gemmatimonadaceae bacterium]